MADAKRDANYVPTIIGVSEVDDSTPINARVDSTNKALYVQIVADDVGIGGGTQYTEDAAAATNPTGTVPILVRADTPAGVTTTDGDNIAQRGTDYGAAYVQVVDSSGNFIDTFGGSGGTATTDDGAFTAGSGQGTPVMGFATSDSVDSGDVGVVAMSTDRRMHTDSNIQQGNADVAAGNPLEVTLANGSVPSHAVTNAGTFAVQEDGDALTALQLIDDAIHADDAAFTLGTSKGVMLMGFAGTQSVDANDAGAIAMDTDGAIHISDGGNTITVDGTVTANLSATDNAVLDQIELNTDDLLTNTNFAAAFGTAGSADSQVMSVQGIASMTPVQVSQATHDSLNANANVQQGNTDVGSGNPLQVTLANGSVPSHAVTNAGTFAVQVDGSALTALQLIDDVVYVDDADWTADTSKHALVGGVTQVTPSANTDGDVTPLITNALRELRTAIPESDLATAGTAHVKKYYTNAGAVTDGIIWSPAAGKRWYITDLIINVSAAATVTLEDDLAAGDSAVMKFELAAKSGISHTFKTPLYSGEDAADLIITTDAGNVYVTVTGYEI